MREDKLTKKKEKQKKEYEEYDPTVNGPEVDYTVTGEISVGNGERGEVIYRSEKHFSAVLYNK